MLFKINQQSIAPYMAMLLYLSLGVLLLSGGTILSISIGLLLFGATIGSYYRNESLLDLWLVILSIASLISLITIAPLDPDLTLDEDDSYKQDTNIRIIITVILYSLFLIYFYFLNKLRQFPKKQIIVTLILFLFITIMVIYLRQ